jgi:mono/diheme cytochrome c family protein
MPRVRRVALVGSIVLAAGCTRALPDADAPGAQMYAARCGTCHAVHDPRSLTAAMWVVQVGRMQETMRRRGAKPLDEQERALVLDYLRSHATDAGSQAAAR